MFWKTKKPADKLTRSEIIQSATKAAENKRTEIGEDTLGQIRDALLKRENSAMSQAKRQIMTADQDKVRDNLKFLMQERD